MVVVMLVAAVAAVLVDVDAVHDDDVVPMMPAPGENRHARDRHDAGDDPETEEVVHAGGSAIEVPPQPQIVRSLHPGEPAESERERPRVLTLPLSASGESGEGGRGAGG